MGRGLRVKLLPLYALYLSLIPHDFRFILYETISRNAMNSLSINAIASIALVTAFSFALAFFDFANTAIVLNTAGIFASLYYMNADPSEEQLANNSHATEKRNDTIELEHIESAKREFVLALIECKNNLNDIYTTQEDAVNILSMSFTSLQELVEVQSNAIQAQLHNMTQQIEKLSTEVAELASYDVSYASDAKQDINKTLQGIIAKAEADSVVADGLEKTAQQLEEHLRTAIRGLQFGDINGQNLQFTIASISFITEHIESLNFTNLNEITDELHEYLKKMKLRKSDNHNPVSATNMSAGDIDLF